MTCPGCNTAMTVLTLEARLGGPIEIDVCTGCQAFWFDLYESPQLAVGSTLKLMSFISEHPPQAAHRAWDKMKCPRCADLLGFSYDFQRNTRFSYWRCPKEHGHFIAFMEFLREKDFIHPLTPKQVNELRQNIGMLNCSHCGAAIDLANSSVCTFCGAPLSMLDMQHPQKLVQALKEGASAKPERQPMYPGQTRPDADASFAVLKAQPDWLTDVSSNGLVHACLGIVVRWIADLAF
jgi:hypothetical protein